MYKIVLFLFFLIISYTPSQSQDLDNIPDSYNVVWNSQSKNSSESMPCGGGSIGLNVWVENDELMMYISKSDAFDENNGLDKLGRLRIRILPDPFKGASFKQELLLKDGYVKISAVKGSDSTNINIWVDVFRPVIHINVVSNLNRTTTATYESWRTETFKERTGENFQNSYKWAPFDTIYTYKDNIYFHDNGVLFYHRNNSYTVFDANVRLQGLDNVKSKLFNPVKDNTFGGFLSGDNMMPDGNTTGKYIDTDFKGWSLISKVPVQRENISVYLHTNQTATLNDWEKELQKVVDEARKNLKTAGQKSISWWHRFWQRSFIVVRPGKNDYNDSIWQAGRNYQLFRYMLGCNAYGSYPTKFNGGLFTYDPVFVDTSKHFTPDYRNWCGGTMTAQNQRLVYFPMLKSGDFDMMKPQFDFYLNALGNAEIRTEQAWGHKGASFTEQIEDYGLPNPAEYGWERPKGYDKGMQYNAWLEYLWDTSLEFCFQILETHRYADADIKIYIPIIESCLTFYNEHYQYLARKRGHDIFDGNGKLVLYPTSGCETFKMAYNSTSTIAALETVLINLLELPKNYLNEKERKTFTEMLNRIPAITYAQHDGHVTIAPAEAYQRIQNIESPQLYPVFPWGIFGVGKPGLDTAINTWNYDPLVKKFRSYVGWKQDNIWAACLGLTSQASDLCIKKLHDSGRRFPAFWGPGFDWTPDHNWGGSGMIGLQEMLMQTTDNRIILFPAWPRDWDVHFRLCAPNSTVVECIYQNGKIEHLSVTPSSRLKDVVLMNK
ncbi:MAG: DUF5703 domain-containing protein [Ignavibacteriaceae bacterium]